MVSLGWAGLDPAHVWDENSSLGLSIPYTTLGQVSALPNEAMNSINQLHLTGRAVKATQGVMAVKARPAGELRRSAVESG